MEGQVRTHKGSERARDTHILETAERGPGQNTGRKLLSEGHSPSGDSRGSDKSKYRKEATERETLTA